jgi:hypothetical protein
MKIVTANRLSDGAVVFLSAQGWVTSIARSAVLSAPDALEAALVSAKRAIANREVIDANAVDVTLDANALPVPVRLRERIRAFGPTVPYGQAPAQAIAA